MERTKNEAFRHENNKDLKAILRRFQLSNAEAMYRNWASDDEVTKYLMWPTHKDVSVSESVLRELQENISELILGGIKYV